MSDINGISTLFNMVYDNMPAFLRALKDVDQLEDFKECLRDYGIENKYLHNIDDNAIHLYITSKTLEEVEAVIHLPLHEDIENIQKQYLNKTQIILINDAVSSYAFPSHLYKDYCFYTVTIDSTKEMTFFDPYIQSCESMLHVDELPGILVMNKDQSVFVPVVSNETIETLQCAIDEDKDLFSLYKNKNDDLYFIQISDLHLGNETNNNGISTLIESLDTFLPMMHSSFNKELLITGDLMDSPSVKNMHLARDFMNYLKKKYQFDITFVLGNHDVIVHGFNFNRTQKSKVVANLLQESIKVLEDEKIILIKMDTNIEGNLARGKVGKRQLNEIEDELSAIVNIEDYTIMVLMHHHLYKIEKSEFVKKKWHENINVLDKLVDNSKALIDASEITDWLKQHSIQYVFHGHKHVPNFKQMDHQYYIGAGKATGGLKERKSRYISYNILKYSLTEKKMKVCLILYYDKQKDNRLRIELNLFEKEGKE